VTRAVGRISQGLQDKLYLGNLEAQRDWGGRLLDKQR
jgi:GDPmannose 4,6-dehydratase